MKIGNRWKLVLLATFFNLSFEYAFRGYTEFLTRPFQPLFLFGAYFAFYTILEDLIVRFKLTNYQLVLAIWPLGLIPMALGTGVLFHQPLFFGINWVNLFFIELLWWGILQAILTFYFANRIVPRDWNHPRMGKLEWLLALGYVAGGFGFIRMVRPPVAPGTPIGYFMFTLLLIVPVIILYFDLKKDRQRSRKSWKFEKSKVLDVLSFGTLVLFLFLGTYFGGHQTFDTASSALINPTARLLINRWTFIYSAVFLLHRWRRGKEVTI